MLLAVVLADLIEVPKNQAVTANETAIFKCKTNRTDKRLLWTVFDHASNPVSIFNGVKVNPAYEAFCRVTPMQGRYDLHVNATPQMAWKFICAEPGAKNIERTAELIVIESPPTCAVVPGNADDTEAIDLTCTMQLSGNWLPTMKWRVNGIQEPLTVTNHTELLDGQRVRVTSTLKSVLVKGKQKYTCHTYFALESYNGDATARNIPTYTYINMVSPDFSGASFPSTLPPTKTPLPDRDSCSIRIGITVALFSAVISGGIIAFICYVKNGKKCPCSDRNKRGGGQCMAATGMATECVTLQ